MIDKKTGLTHKQMLFAHRFLIHFNGTKAYKEAYDTNKTMSDNTAGVEAHRHLNNPKIIDYMYHKKQKVFRKEEITVEFVLKEILDLLKECKLDGSKAIASRQLENLAKWLQMFVEKKEILHSHKRTVFVLDKRSGAKQSNIQLKHPPSGALEDQTNVA